MTRNKAVHRKRVALLLSLLIWVTARPYAYALSPTASASEAKGQTWFAASQPFVVEVASVTPGAGNKWAEVAIVIRSNEPSLTRVTISSQTTDKIIVKPAAQTIAPGQGGDTRARFRLYNPSGNWADLGALSFIASGDVNGLAHKVAITVDLSASGLPENLFHRPHWTWLAMVVSVVLIPLLCRRVRNAISAGYQKIFDRRFLLELFTLVVVEIYIISKLNPEFLVTSTITTGGDTASHYYTLKYLRDVLLPAGQVSGWTPGNYAGFPILQFYFPLVFLIMKLLSGIVSLQVAFKLGSVAGTLLFPVCVYGMLRLIRCPFPGPGIGAALTLPFLFNSSHSMWGGNILSSFAGEFSYSLSMALSVILIGSLYRGVRDNRGVIINGLLVFLVGFSHGYTLLFVEAMSLFLLITPTGFIQRLFYLGKVYALGFFLLSFWIVPLLVFTKYTTSYHLVWTIHSVREVFPPILLPSLLLGGLGTLGLIAGGIWKFRDVGKDVLPTVGYLWFGLAMVVVFFVAAPRIGVVDIRYVPYGHLIGTLLAATALGWLGWSLKHWKVDCVLLPAILVWAMLWTDHYPGPISDWAKWNYEGFEAKATWPTFEGINRSLKGDFNDPRVVFEHSELHNSFGSSRAFESLPLFAGRATLEGLYMQASISAPFVFYIQSQVSEQKSVPFPQYSYSSLNFDRARPRLEKFNVRDLIIRSNHAKKAIRQAKGYVLRDTIGNYELWELTTNRNRYVEALNYEPVLFPTSSWKEDSYRWFVDESLLQSHLVFIEADVTRPFQPFKALARDLVDVPRIPVETGNCAVQERIGYQDIRIDTDCIGKPLLVKMSYHPNWHVEGADRIYLTSPSFMLIYPRERHVRLYYGLGTWGRVGQALTITALIILLMNIPLAWRQGFTIWELIAARMHINPSLVPQITFDPSLRNRWIMLAVAVAVAGVAIARSSYVVYHSNPNRIYNQAIILKDQKRFEEARQGFRSVISALGASDLAQNAAYYLGITYYLEKRDKEAITAFEDLIRLYPKSNWIPEVEYHIGLGLYRTGQEDQGSRQMQKLRELHPGTLWAELAGDRLREHKALIEAQQSLNEENIARFLSIAIDHFNHDRLEEAKTLLEEITVRFPHYSGAPKALAALALVYYKQENCKMTMVRYKELIDRFPKDKLVPEAYYHLGICSETLGDVQKGQSYFSRTVREYPETVYGRQARQKLR